MRQPSIYTVLPRRLEAFSWLEIKMDKLELNNVIWYNSNKYIVGGILWHHRK